MKTGKSSGSSSLFVLRYDEEIYHKNSQKFSVHEYRDEHEIEFPESMFEPLREGGYGRIGLLCSIQYINHMQD